MRWIPVTDDLVEVERWNGDLWVYLEEPLELDERGQTMVLAILCWFAQEHWAAHPRSEGWVGFCVGPDFAFIDTLDAAQVEHCLESLLAAIRIFGVRVEGNGLAVAA